jgi:hypothetical protein
MRPTRKRHWDVSARDAGLSGHYGARVYPLGRGRWPQQGAGGCDRVGASHADGRVLPQELAVGPTGLEAKQERALWCGARPQRSSVRHAKRERRRPDAVL